MPRINIDTISIFNCTTLAIIKFLIIILLYTIITSTQLSCSKENQTTSKEIQKSQITTCSSNGAWCKSTSNNISILLPKKIPYLKPFPVQVRFKNDQLIKKLQIQISMQSMQMSVNRFNLIKKQDKQDTQIYQTEVVIPLCVTGRKDWLVTIDMQTEHEQLSFYYLINIPN